MAKITFFETPYFLNYLSEPIEKQRILILLCLSGYIETQIVQNGNLRYLTLKFDLEFFTISLNPLEIFFIYFYAVALQWFLLVRKKSEWAVHNLMRK